MTAYPVIDDPEHPLWEAQQAGWPDHTPHQAMTEAVRHTPKGGRSDSSSHPAFAEDYIKNALAERPPGPDETEASVPAERR